MADENVARRVGSIYTILFRVADFVANQTRKTIARPSRIFEIVFNLTFRLYSSYAQYVFRCLPLQWRPTHLQATFYFTQAKQLLDVNQPNEAWNAFQRCLPSSQQPDRFAYAAVCLAQGLGRYRESIACYARANELRLQRAIDLGVATDRLRVLNNFWASSIGHTATLDYVIKLGILEGRAPQDTILYVPEGSRVANRFLLDQFRPLLRFVERPQDLPFPESAVGVLQFAFLWPRRPDNSTVYFWELAAETYQRWQSDGRQPLLDLPAEVEERGREALAAAGVPRDAWFVGLHVREAGFNTHHRDLHDVLNARIDDYLPAIAEITRRGGWVIRMGDPSMFKLPPLLNTLDYCHCAWRSDWMDVFIAAKCRFFIGTASGPTFVPPLYGVRSVLTNWWPPGQRPWHAGDIYIPKSYRRLSDLRRLTLAESLVEPFGWCNSVNWLEDQYGVRVEDNAAEDIKAAVIEMLESLESGKHGSEDELAIHLRAEPIFQSHSAFGMARLASAFLRRHPSYLDQ